MHRESFCDGVFFKSMFVAVALLMVVAVVVAMGAVLSMVMPITF